MSRRALAALFWALVGVGCATAPVTAPQPPQQKLVAVGPVSRADVQRAIAVLEADPRRDEGRLAELYGKLAAYQMIDGAFAAATATFGRAIEIAARLDRREALARFLRTQSRAQGAAGARKAAEASARRALGIDLALDARSVAVADDRDALGDQLLPQQRLDEAMVEYRQSIELRESKLDPGDPGDLGFTNALTKVANVFAVIRDFDHALPLYERVIAIYRKHEGPDSSHAALTTVLLVNTLLLAEELDGPAALQRLDPALATLQRANTPRLVLRPALETRTKILIRMNAPSARAGARDLYQRFADEDLRSGDRVSYASSQQKLGLACMSLRDRVCALEALSRGVETEAQIRPANSLALGLSRAVLASGYYVFGEYGKAVDEYAAALEATIERAGAVVEQQRTALELGSYFDALYRARRPPTGQPGSAAGAGLLALQLSQQSRAALAMARMAERTAHGQGPLPALVRREQDLETQRVALERAFADALTLTGPQRTEQTAKVRAQLAAADAAASALRAELANHPEYQALTAPPVVRPELLQRQLEPGELLLAFHFTRAGGFVWGLEQNALSWARVDLTDVALDAEVRALRASLDPSGAAARGLRQTVARAPSPSFDRARAHRLYQKLFGQLEAPLARARRLLVVPSGALESLPFGVLVTSEPSDSTSYRDTAWLVRDKAVLVLPSISALSSLRGQRGAPAGKSFIGVGNPRLTARTQAWGLPPLPTSEAELRALAATLGQGDVLVGEHASEEALHGLRLDAYRVIAFSTHGLKAAETQALSGIREPALVLSAPAPGAVEDGDGDGDGDGFLTASEIASLKLRADWVILSACNTAAGDGSTREEALSGLARAFIYAGARALLVSHWSVYDHAAYDLTTKTLALVQEHQGLGRAEALQRAMLATMQEPGKADPAYWAPFSIVGDGDTR